MQVTVNNEQKRIRISKSAIRATAEKALRALSLPPESAAVIILVGRAKMRSLNRKYFKKYRVTDVIALGYTKREKRPKGKPRTTHAPGRVAVSGPGQAVRFRGKELFQNYLGDVIICPSVALENSKIYKTSLAAELRLYVIHGILHLLGYGDQTEGERSSMRRKEKELLGA